MLIFLKHTEATWFFKAAAGNYNAEFVWFTIARTLEGILSSKISPQFLCSQNCWYNWFLNQKRSGCLEAVVLVMLSTITRRTKFWASFFFLTEEVRFPNYFMDFLLLCETVKEDKTKKKDIQLCEQTMPHWILSKWCRPYTSWRHLPSSVFIKYGCITSTLPATKANKHDTRLLSPSLSLQHIQSVAQDPLAFWKKCLGNKFCPF